MYIAIELKQMLKEQDIDTRKLAAMDIKAFYDATDALSVKDHLWLKNLNVTFEEPIRTGTPEMDASLTAGMLLAQQAEGILVTSVPSFLSKGSLISGKNVLYFTDSLKEAAEMYKKVGKKAAKPKTEKPAKQKEKVVESTSVSQQVSTEPTPVNEFPHMPEPQPEPAQTSQQPVVSEAETPEATQNAVPTEVVVNQPAPAMFQVEEMPVNPTADAVPMSDMVPEPIPNTMTYTTTPVNSEPVDMDNPFAMPDPQMEDTTPVQGDPFNTPEYDYYKRAAIGAGVANASVKYVLSALQQSHNVNDYLDMLLKVYDGYETESYTLYGQTREQYDVLKAAADQVAPYYTQI